MTRCSHDDGLDTPQAAGPHLDFLCSNMTDVLPTALNHHLSDCGFLSYILASVGGMSDERRS